MCVKFLSHLSSQLFPPLHTIYKYQLSQMDPHDVLPFFASCFTEVDPQCDELAKIVSHTFTVARVVNLV